MSEIYKALLITAAVVAMNAPARADPKFDYLPNAQAVAMQQAIEKGARLTPYDKQFLFWMGLNLVKPDCGIVGSAEAEHLEMVLSEAAAGSLFTDPFEAVHAQADFVAHVSSMVQSPCHNEDGKLLLNEIVTVLTEDNKGSRSDFGEKLEELGILPNPKDSGGGHTAALTAPLYESKVVRFTWGSIDLVCIQGANDGTEKVCGQIIDLLTSNSVRILSCAYGPFYVDGTGYQTYQFWYENPPKDFAAFEIAGRPHPFNWLGSAKVDACPGDSEAALKFRRQNSL